MRRVGVWLRLGIGAALLAWVVRRADLHELSIQVGPRLALGVLAAIGLLAVAQALAALRWRVILGASAPAWSYLFRLYLIGLFFSLFLPTSVGGDTVRAAAASARRRGDAGLAVASVLLDRVVGVLALVFYCAVGMFVDTSSVAQLAKQVAWKRPATPVLALAAAAAVGGLALVVVVLRRSASVRSAVAQARHLTLAFVKSPAAVIKAMGLGLAVQAAYILVWAGLGQGLAWRLSLGFLLFAVPFVSLCAMAPVSISGLGVREGAWLLLLAPLGIPAAHAVAYGLLYFLCVMAVAGIGGLLFALRGLGA